MGRWQTNFEEFLCVCLGLALLLGGKSENVLWGLPLPTGHCFLPSFLLKSLFMFLTIQSGQKCEMFGLLHIKKEVLFMVLI